MWSLESVHSSWGEGHEAAADRMCVKTYRYGEQEWCGKGGEWLLVTAAAGRRTERGRRYEGKNEGEGNRRAAKERQRGGGVD